MLFSNCCFYLFVTKTCFIYIPYYCLLIGTKAYYCHVPFHRDIAIVFPTAATKPQGPKRERSGEGGPNFWATIGPE